ncbi:hypothetical protein EJ02DRAFT_494903 [Clathrospora elynae]|uniref:RRM domain-containing protein n=1 Tax=Clathrospora elynae TaxID=706981 RepID=A0A6A5SI76_9PLEO|nr:hypothetical protein EJ02DRAFT_494903 [Clathrospora elynae]
MNRAKAALGNIGRAEDRVIRVVNFHFDAMATDVEDLFQGLTIIYQVRDINVRSHTDSVIYVLFATVNDRLLAEKLASQYLLDRAIKIQPAHSGTYKLSEDSTHFLGATEITAFKARKTGAGDATAATAFHLEQESYPALGAPPTLPSISAFDITSPKTELGAPKTLLNLASAFRDQTLPTGANGPPSAPETAPSDSLRSLPRSTSTSSPRNPEIGFIYGDMSLNTSQSPIKPSQPPPEHFRDTKERQPPRRAIPGTDRPGLVTTDSAQPGLNKPWSWGQTQADLNRRHTAMPSGFGLGRGFFGQIIDCPPIPRFPALRTNPLGAVGVCRARQPHPTIDTTSSLPQHWLHIKANASSVPPRRVWSLSSNEHPADSLLSEADWYGFMLNQARATRGALDARKTAADRINHEARRGGRREDRRGGAGSQ